MAFHQDNDDTKKMKHRSTKMAPKKEEEARADKSRLSSPQGSGDSSAWSSSSSTGDYDTKPKTKGQRPTENPKAAAIEDDEDEEYEETVAKTGRTDESLDASGVDDAGQKIKERRMNTIYCQRKRRRRREREQQLYNDRLALEAKNEEARVERKRLEKLLEEAKAVAAVYEEAKASTRVRHAQQQQLKTHLPLAAMVMQNQTPTLVSALSLPQVPGLHMSPASMLLDDPASALQSRYLALRAAQQQTPAFNNNAISQERFLVGATRANNNLLGVTASSLRAEELALLQRQAQLEARERSLGASLPVHFQPAMTSFAGPNKRSLDALLAYQEEQVPGLTKRLKQEIAATTQHAFLDQSYLRQQERNHFRAQQIVPTQDRINRLDDLSLFEQAAAMSRSYPQQSLPIELYGHASELDAQRLTHTSPFNRFGTASFY